MPRVGTAQRPAAQAERYMTGLELFFRSEVHRGKLGVAIAVAAGRLKTSR
jgi:hypothetical protein